ncbi:MAG: hypothetical protein ACP5OU_05850 [Methanothrix sp.]
MNNDLKSGAFWLIFGGTMLYFVNRQYFDGNIYTLFMMYIIGILLGALAAALGYINALKRYKY